MSAPRTDMHRPQELVRLHRFRTRVRERARFLGLSTRTEQRYRLALDAAGLLTGDATELPELSVLRAAIEAERPPPAPRQVASSIDVRLPAIRADLERGVGPQAIWDRMRR